MLPKTDLYCWVNIQGYETEVELQPPERHGEAFLSLCPYQGTNYTLKHLKSRCLFKQNLDQVRSLIDSIFSDGLREINMASKLKNELKRGIQKLNFTKNKEDVRETTMSQNGDFMEEKLSKMRVLKAKDINFDEGLISVTDRKNEDRTEYLEVKREQLKAQREKITTKAKKKKEAPESEEIVPKKGLFEKICCCIKNDRSQGGSGQNGHDDAPRPRPFFSITYG